jgi:hypothetical protein
MNFLTTFRKLTLPALIASLFPVFSTQALAADPSPVGSLDLGRKTQLANPIYAYGQLGTLFSTLFTIILLAGAVTAIGVFIFGAIQYGTAGDSNGAAKARQSMTGAVVGLVLLGLVYVFLTYYNRILPSA